MTQQLSNAGAPAADLRLMDASLSEAVANGCHLACAVHSRGIDFAALDLHRSRYLAIESFRGIQTEVAQQLEAALQASTLANFSWQSVSVALAGVPFTLLPNALYSAGCELDVLRFNHPLPADAQAASDRIEDLELRVIYQLPAALQQTFATRFPGVQFVHGSTALLSGLLQVANRTKGQQVFVNVRSQHIDLTVLSGDTLLFHNAFAWQVPEDLAYYTLYTLEQLGLNSATIPVYLTGEVKMDSPVYRLLKNYLGKLDFQAVAASPALSASLSSAPKHYFFNLLNQYLCVS